MYLTYKYRLLPTKKQHARLLEILEDQRQLYNAALQERIDCYKKTGKGLNYYDQVKELTVWRKEDNYANSSPLNVQRWTLKRLDDAYKAFFSRLKKKSGKAGFPRYRGKGWWNSFGFSEFAGITFDGKRLRFKSMPSGLRVHLHRPLPADADIKACSFTKTDKGWHVCLSVKIPNVELRELVNKVGIDVGLETFAYMSDGTFIPNPRIAKKAEREQRIRQRAIARCKKGSKGRQKARAQYRKACSKVTNTKNTWLHQQSAMLVKKYDLIAVEKLNVKNMVKNHHLAKSIADASWSRFFTFLEYKAERAGVLFVKVDPRGTSQICSGCGAVVKKPLSQREHFCPHCGLVLNRDENAARNILTRCA